MRIVPKILYFVAFVVLAVVAALALNRVISPPLSEDLVRAVMMAALLGAPGLVHRRLWPLAVVLLPLGAYIILRTTLPLPEFVEGSADQMRFYFEALRTGATQYMEEFFPLDLTGLPELGLTFVFTVYWVVGTASFVGMSLRRALPAMAVMLVLIGFSLTVDTTARALGSALAFVILGLCLLVLSRGLDRRNWRFREAAAGGLVGVIGVGIALAVLVSAPSAVAQPWQDWRAWDPFRGGGSNYSFDWLQNYPELLDPGNDVNVMTVQSTSPSYWRANALDRFTGGSWETSQVFEERLDVVQEDGSSIYTIPGTRPAPQGEEVNQIFTLNSIYTSYLFAGGDPRILRMDVVDVPVHINDMRSLYVNQALGPDLRYTVAAVIPDWAPEDFAGRGDSYPRALEPYLELPLPKTADIGGDDPDAAWRELMSDPAGTDMAQWAELYSLNQEIVGDATDPYDKTLRLEQYLRESYTYSLVPPESELSSPYAAFLFDTRQGYCQHFAGAMALLLRYNGIPARVAVGFTAGRPSGDVYSVSTNNAHAWVEAYFPEVGWAPFDPTPGRDLPTPGPSSTSPGFADPFASSSQGTGTTTPEQAQQGPAAQDPEGGESAEKSGAATGTLAWLPWVLTFLVAVVAWPFALSLWRRRGLHRGSLERRLEASLRLLRVELSDFGVKVSPAHTTEEALELVRIYLGLEPDAGFVERAEAILFGERQATQEDFDCAEDLRREVQTRLRRRGGWVRTGLTWYGVPQRIPSEGVTA